MGVSTREAVSIDRLNDTASAELQPFTAGLNLSKSQEETNSADRAVSALLLLGGAGTAATQDFREAGTFLQWQNQSIVMCHRTRCHVNHLLLL